MIARIQKRIDQGQLLPYRWTHLGGLLNTLLLVHLRRPLLRRQVAHQARGGDADIAVLIAHRNRADFRLRNALRAIRGQAGLSQRLDVLVVDYGSDPLQRAAARAMVDAAGGHFVSVDGVTGWNKAHCLNVGLRRITTPFVMVSDVDVLLSPGYLAQALSLLAREPLGMVLAPCVHLPQSLTDELMAAAELDVAPDVARLRPHGVIKTAGNHSPGMIVAPTAALRMIGGYDEYYRDYGSEDVDLNRRLAFLGLRTIVMDGADYYLHQWHPRHEGVQSPGLQAQIAANAEYLRRTRTIKRNPGGWGEARVTGES